MPKEEYVRDPSGNITHIRVTSDDGRRSDLYEYDDSFIGGIAHDGKGAHVEVAEHLEDGTTEAYEPDDSFIGGIAHDGKGAHK